MKKLLLIICLVFMVGCESVDYKKLMSDNEYVIVDVRDNFEYEENHVIGAVNVPLSEIDSYDFDDDKIIFVYCFSGMRSKEAYNFLKSKGFEVYDLGSIDSIDLPKEYLH